MATPAYTIRSIRFIVPSRSGGEDHIVSVDPRDGLTRCTCTAGSFGKDCHAQAAVRAGEAGKPIVRVTAKLPRTVRLSAAGRDLQTALEV